MKERLAQKVAEALKQVSPDIQLPPHITIEVPKGRRFGDFSTNLVIQIAPQLKVPLYDFAVKLAQKIFELDTNKIFSKVEAARNGFVNFTLKDALLQENLRTIKKEGSKYGKSSIFSGRKALIEFVSANPTGPLHIGHGRWAVIGDDIASLLEAVGYSVEREFYVNDIGNQINMLEASVRARAEGREVPEGGYGGAYIQEVAKELAPKLNKSDFKKILVNRMLVEHKRVLNKLGVKFSQFFAESSLHDKGKVKNAVQKIESTGKTYKDKGALWFRSEEFGDDKDRVLIRESGESTYFAADIAYHLDKFERKYDLIINIWGTDHHGYVNRLKAALKALKLPIEKFEIIIGQLVALFRGKEPVRMSKRTGEMITLEEVIDEIGRDATRLFLTMTKVHSHLEFDLELAKEQAPSNPVYYVQYAHARICSIFNEAKDKNIKLKSSADLGPLKEKMERDLMLKLLDLEDVIVIAAQKREPHTMVEYGKELSQLLHSYYQKHRVMSDDPELTQARLALMSATRIVLENVLKLLKVSAPERM